MHLCTDSIPQPGSSSRLVNKIQPGQGYQQEQKHTAVSPALGIWNALYSQWGTPQSRQRSPWRAVPRQPSWSESEPYTYINLEGGLVSAFG